MFFHILLYDYILYLFLSCYFVTAGRYYFKRTDVAAPYMELYCQLSATDNIVLLLLKLFFTARCSNLCAFIQISCTILRSSEIPSEAVYYTRKSVNTFKISIYKDYGYLFALE